MNNKLCDNDSESWRVIRLVRHIVTMNDIDAIQLRASAAAQWQLINNQISLPSIEFKRTVNETSSPFPHQKSNMP